LLARKDQSRYYKPLILLNNDKDNVLHIACRYGNVEIIKQVINKLNNSQSTIITSNDQYLLSKNKDGYTCFHIACKYGFYNIVEYFLRDAKQTFFLEHRDNEGNSPLHTAALNGYLNIANLIIENDENDGNNLLYSKNDQNNTPLEMSCRNGHLEVSKSLISFYSIDSTIDNNEVTLNLNQEKKCQDNFMFFLLINI
jgi:ankyrin repeat protein